MSHSDGSQKSSIRRRTALGVLACGLLGVAALAGCGKPPTVIVEKGAANGEKQDPWKAVAKQLRKDPDAASVRAALGKLGGALAADPQAPKPRGLTPQEEEALAKLVPLNKEDRDEIHDADFTSHDAVYVADCLYLRDALRSFDVPEVAGEKPERAAARRADAAFAWVCRQVYLEPWLIPAPGDPTRVQGSALPPTWVLRRGYGSGLERMYILLALLQQMGLDGCLVGPKEAATLPAAYVAYGTDKSVLTGKPRGPFWAVGVRAGGDVRLYDPWRGQAFPAALGQLKADPDAHKAWLEDKANVSGVSAALARDAAVFLAVPVNALAPRLALLEEQSRADLGARFAVDAAKLQSAFPESKFWNPPTDQFSYGRTARLFLPTDLGGADPSGVGGGLFGFYLRSQLPAEQQLILPELLAREELRVDVGNRIVQLAQGSYGVAFVYPPPTPRERLQRGQFQDAARELVNRQDLFGRGLERLRRNPDAEKQIKAWADAALELYSDLGRALTNRDQDGASRARAALDAHWARQAAVQLLMDRAVSAVGLAEATRVLAQCKHEQAERLQTRLDAGAGDAAKLRAEAASAWSDALDAWRSYAPHAEAHAGFPGRADHARALTARAEAMAAKK